MFLCSDLRQSMLAICNFGIDAAFFFGEVDYFKAGIPCFSFLKTLLLYSVPEQILIHRDGVGLSELRAECTLSFGNCLWVSYIYFSTLTFPKLV